MIELKKYDKGKIILLCGVFLVMTGFGMTLPVLPFYIEKILSYRDISSNRVSLHIGLITGAFPLTQFLFAPYLGSLSDKVGRRPLILTGIAGFSISTFIFSLGESLVLIYISRLIAGIFAASFVTASGAYIADKTPKEKRGKNFAILNGVAGLGAVTGHLLGNLFSNISIQFKFLFTQFTLDKYSSPFVFSSLLTIAVLVLYVILLPESNNISNKTIEQGATKTKISFIPSFKSLKKAFILLLALSFFSQLAHSMFEGTFAIHSQRFFLFGPKQMSIVLIICGLLMGLLQLGPIAWLIEKKGERALLPFGCLFLGIGLFMLTISREMGWILFYVSFISVGIAILTPSLTSLVTKDSGKEYGTSLGIFSAVNSLGQVAGVVMGGIIMIWSDHLAYWIVAVILVVFSYLVLPKTTLLVRKG
ncbi:MAG: MFS transporter [Chitinophagaceae bacterium]|jgi:DHA1 family multidrug resistance protein-like MFS transporter|nr:MFS transporter [Chitinophagaceae bacterium]MCA6448493.1 MFS transporter [Chitinophagaceae bacterium]